MPSVLVVHGPNLDQLGRREPAVYGRTTLPEIDVRLTSLGVELRVTVACFQSNWEGAIVDRLHVGDFDGVVINPAGLTHTSVVLRDALLASARPFVEVHLSNVHAREAFRRTSLLADVALGVLGGFGPMGYEFALRGLVAHLRREEER